MNTAQKKKHTERYIADRFRDFRKDLGMSQEAFAKYIGFPYRETVADMERGKRRALASDLITLLTKTGRSLSDFLD